METAYTADFADGTYRFWLPMPRVVAAEREMGRDGNPRSIFALFYDIGEALGAVGDADVLAGSMAATIREAHILIRHALIGGGEAMVEGAEIAVGDALARELVDTYCYPARPALHDVGLAWRILRAAIYGIDTSGSKKKAEASADPAPS